jgi:hypothetical protein
VRCVKDWYGNVSSDLMCGRVVFRHWQYRSTQPHFLSQSIHFQV